MRTAVISQSPEEVCDYFFQQIKKYNIPHKVRVWSRKDGNSKGDELFILSQRDYNYLAKEKLLPDSQKTVVLFTEKTKHEAHKMDPSQGMICYIAGTEQERACLAAEYYMMTHSPDTMLSEELSWKKFSLETIKLIKLPSWLKLKLGAIFVDLTPLESKLSFSEAKDRVLIKAQVPKIDISASRLVDLIRPLGLDEDFDLLQLVLSKIFHECSYCLIDERDKKGTTLFISFLKASTQKKYENSAKMYGVVS